METMCQGNGLSKMDCIAVLVFFLLKIVNAIRVESRVFVDLE